MGVDKDVTVGKLMFEIPTAFYAKTVVIYSTKEFFQHRRFHNVASSKAGEKKINK